MSDNPRKDIEELLNSPPLVPHTTKKLILTRQALINGDLPLVLQQHLPNLSELLSLPERPHPEVFSFTDSSGHNYRVSENNLLIFGAWGDCLIWDIT
jgi:hypothetical protein